MQMSRLIKEGGKPGVGGGWASRRGELNKDVSRPDRERERERGRRDMHGK